MSGFSFLPSDDVQNSIPEYREPISMSSYLTNDGMDYKHGPTSESDGSIVKVRLSVEGDEISRRSLSADEIRCLKDIYKVHSLDSLTVAINHKMSVEDRRTDVRFEYEPTAAMETPAASVSTQPPPSSSAAAVSDSIHPASMTSESEDVDLREALDRLQSTMTRLDAMEHRLAVARKAPPAGIPIAPPAPMSATKAHELAVVLAAQRKTAATAAAARSPPPAHRLMMTGLLQKPSAPKTPAIL